MDIAAKSSSAAATILASALPEPSAAAWPERDGAFCVEAMDGQAEDDFKNSESDEEMVVREEFSPITKVKSDPKESLGAFH